MTHCYGDVCSELAQVVTRELKLDLAAAAEGSINHSWCLGLPQDADKKTAAIASQPAEAFNNNVRFTAEITETVRLVPNVIEKWNPTVGVRVHLDGLYGALGKYVPALAVAYTVDPAAPTSNARPHFWNKLGGHLYAIANGDWVLNYESTPGHVDGMARITAADGGLLPVGGEMKDVEGNARSDEAQEVMSRWTKIWVDKDGRRGTVPPQDTRTGEVRLKWLDDGTKSDYIQASTLTHQVLVSGCEWENVVGTDKKIETRALRLEDLATAADVEAAEVAAGAELAEWTAKLKKTDETIKEAAAAFKTEGGGEGVADFLHSRDAEAKLLYGPVELWGVSEVNGFRRLFEDCMRFNVDISGWRVDAAQNMEYMFSSCSAFNQPLGQRQVGKVHTTSYMFNGCNAFNQPLGDWQVGEVQNMEKMFHNCRVFNQPLGQWQVGQVQSMKNMFRRLGGGQAFKNSGL